MELLIGFTGMSLILFAFVMNQINKWKNDSLIYDAFNAVGGLLMMIYALMLNSYPFLILNGVWTIVSVRDIFLALSRKK